MIYSHVVSQTDAVAS